MRLPRLLRFVVFLPPIIVAACATPAVEIGYNFRAYQLRPRGQAIDFTAPADDKHCVSKDLDFTVRSDCAFTIARRCQPTRTGKLEPQRCEPLFAKAKDRPFRDAPAAGSCPVAQHFSAGYGIIYADRTHAGMSVLCLRDKGGKAEAMVDAVNETLKFLEPSQ